MTKSSDDTDEMTIDFSSEVTQPPSVDPAVLRRAMKYGQKARHFFPTQSFTDVEVSLKARWVQKGESTEWDWVRDAVRVGFDPDSLNED